MDPVGPRSGPADRDSPEAAVAARLARRERRARLQTILLPLLVAAPILLFWELYTNALRNPLIPGPSRLVAVMPEVLANPRVLSGLLSSNLSLLLGYLAALGVGIPLGLLMGRVRLVDGALSILLDIAIVTPMVVVMPVVLIALGLTRESQAVIIFVFALPLVTLMCRAGTREVPRELIEMATSFGADERRIWREVLLPGSVPGIGAALRLGFGQAITGMAVVELTLLAIGIGNVILDYQSSFRTAQTFDVIAILMVEAVVAMWILRAVVNRMGGQTAAATDAERALA